MPSILITGCSSGIGYDAAHRLRDAGWQVVASCRKSADCERLRGEGFLAPQLDLADMASIEDGFAATMEACDGRLDAVFHNGAHALPGALEDVPTEGLREIFEANFFGWHHLNRLIVPTMRAHGGGRVLFCSSVLGFVATPWRGAYVATKFALEGYVDTLRLEWQGSGLHPILIEPGPIATRFRQNAIPHFEKHIDWQDSALADLYRSRLIKRLYEKGKPDRFELGPGAVSDVVLKALTAASPKPRYRVTLPTHIAWALRRLLPVRQTDKVLRRS